MAECPKCKTELKPEQTSCPHCEAAQAATAKMTALPTRKLGLGDALIVLGCFMFGVTALLYLIGYLDDRGNFSMALLAIIALMLSPAAPLLITFLSMKNPGLLRLNYFYAAFIWLMKLTGVSIMQVGTLTKFITAVDFWLVLGATFIAAGTYAASRDSR